MTLLPDSFRGINDRFHLAGFYALAAVVWHVSVALAGEDPAWGLVAGAILVLYFGVGCGISGMVFQEAAQRSERIAFGLYARALFAPLLWLWLQANLIVSGLVCFGAAAYFVAFKPEGQFQDLANATAFWAGPLVELAVDTLLLYAWPIRILARERGARRNAIREGWRLLRARPADSCRLLLLLLLAVGLKGGLVYTRGPRGQNAPPDVPEVLIVFAGSYLELVALYGSARVVLKAADGEADAGRAADAASSRPGPPA